MQFMIFQITSSFIVSPSLGSTASRMVVRKPVWISSPPARPPLRSLRPEWLQHNLQQSRRQAYTGYDSEPRSRRESQFDRGEICFVYVL